MRLAYLSPASSIPVWAPAVSSGNAGASLFPLHHPAVPQGSEGICAHDIKDRMVGQELVAVLAVGSLSFGTGDALGSGFPGLGATPGSQMRGEGSICVASNARRQLGPGDSAGSQLMDLGSSSCPRYHT